MENLLDCGSGRTGLAAPVSKNNNTGQEEQTNPYTYDTGAKPESKTDVFALVDDRDVG